MDRSHLWPKTLGELCEAVEWRIAAQRFKTAPREAVGIIWPDGTITSLANRAKDPSHEYFVELRDISLAITGKGLSPVAIWHSHWETEAIPSEADETQLRTLMKQNDRPLMFIYGVDGLRVWTWDDGLEEITGEVAGG